MPGIVNTVLMLLTVVIHFKVCKVEILRCVDIFLLGIFKVFITIFLLVVEFQIERSDFRPVTRLVSFL